MAARRKTGAKKTRASAKKRRSGTRTPKSGTPPKRSVTKKTSVTRAGAKKVASKKTATARQATRASPKKKIASKRSAVSQPKARSKSKAAAKRSTAKKRAAVKKRPRVVRPTPAQRGSITRATNVLVELGTPRTWWRQSLKDLYARRRASLVGTLERAGYSPESIRARLGAITQRRNRERVRVAVARLSALGTALLDRKTRAGTWVEPDRASILRSMITERDERFLEFLRTVQDELGLDYQEAVNEWFSPKVM